MQISIKLGIVSLLAGLSIPAFGGQETHGGDVILTSPDGIALLDHAECEREVWPEENKEVWANLEKMLDILRTTHQFHNTANYLESYLKHGRLQWCLSVGPLRDVQDEGGSVLPIRRPHPFIRRPHHFDFSNPLQDLPQNPGEDLQAPLPQPMHGPLVLAYDKRQVAVNYDDGLVVFAKDLYEKLNVAMLTKLYLHEVLWHATGFSLVKSGQVIRELNNLFLSNELANRSTDHLMNHVKGRLGTIANDSPLYQRMLVDFDQKGRSFSKFIVSEVDTDNGLQKVIRPKSNPKTTIRAISQINPNPAAAVIYQDRFGVLSAGSNVFAKDLEVVDNREDLCSNMRTNGLDWRLPTGLELMHLAELGLAKVRYAVERHFVLVASKEEPMSPWIHGMLESALFPSFERAPLVFLTQEGTIVNFKTFVDLTSDYSSLDFDVLKKNQEAARILENRLGIKVSTEKNTELVYPKYVCVSEDIGEQK